MSKRKTTEEFIEDAKKVHNNYDYSKVEYIHNKSKVIIICKKHGEFQQAPNNYLRGCGCPKCIGKAKVDIEEFIKRSQKVHGHKYDYDKVILKTLDKKIIIICPEHGEFQQIAKSHLNGNGCSKCAGLAKSTTEEFIEKANRIHNHKYDYSKVVYKGCDKKVKIICYKHGEFLQTPYAHLKGQNCIKCCNCNKKTTEEFIEKANKIHGHKYDYSKVVYKNRNAKIKIICKKHGEFLQQPANHLQGQGCSKCYGNVRGNKKEFIEKANKIHNYKYDYSKVVYKNRKTKVKIICPEHGEFLQTPGSHFRSGCPFYKLLDTNKFIKKANKIHNHKFDYSKVDYINNKIKVIIICKDHGKFLQEPANHLQGQGCPKCCGNIKSTTEEFIEKANKIHNHKYDYSKVVYKGAFDKVIIICPKHGKFLQRPSSHLSGSNCPKCIGNVSVVSQLWLDQYNVPLKNREKTVRIGKSRFKVDALDEENKIIYEFNGDFWHGNPKKYDPESINPVNKIKFGELYKKTIEKRKKLETAGFTVISIWESDFTPQHLPQ